MCKRFFSETIDVGGIVNGFGAGRNAGVDAESDEDFREIEMMFDDDQEAQGKKRVSGGSVLDKVMEQLQDLLGGEGASNTQAAEAAVADPTLKTRRFQKKSRKYPDLDTVFGNKMQIRNSGISIVVDLTDMKHGLAKKGMIAGRKSGRRGNSSSEWRNIRNGAKDAADGRNSTDLLNMDSDELGEGQDIGGYGDDDDDGGSYGRDADGDGNAYSR
jgi:hypothetical protein